MSSSEAGLAHSSAEDDNPEETFFLSKIGGAVSSHKSVFCCGGSTPIVADDDSRFDCGTTDKKQLTSPPVILRWDLPSGKAIRKLTLPPIVKGEEGQTAIKELLQDCSPATFGKNGEEVLDEAYRKAAKLDSSQFSTNFNPHDVGIIDVITQTLLPGIAKPFPDTESIWEEHLGVIAELYKLNIYSAPSGKFRPHVDTPRGATQFGSLVVCLPNPHQGGQLRVAHHGLEMEWDWSNKRKTEDDESIEWAAFYSDCEHEVKEVTSGHRVTLTYNLYVHERVGGIMRDPPTLDLSSMVLYHRVKEALASPAFMKDGGTLGFYCRHAYAHTNDYHNERLPMALKGLDAVFYATFYHLVHSVGMHAVMDDLNDEQYSFSEVDSNDEDYDAELVATGLHGIQISDEGGDDGSASVREIVKDAWRSKWRKDIHWFGEPGHQEIAIVHLAYGNQPSIVWHYSSAAILVTIPGFNSKVRKELREGRGPCQETAGQEKAA
ncbi:hypothetical protein ABVK25_011702 [Lepraria finkii]|uniref:Fe2OG dioxygenase domain-containing protein n=1 Tax=Lepraria finkii TaxID=1340010 RepID=A0ABR4APC3_9LECA